MQLTDDSPAANTLAGKATPGFHGCLLMQSGARHATALTHTPWKQQGMGSLLLLLAANPPQAAKYCM